MHAVVRASPLLLASLLSGSTLLTTGCASPFHRGRSEYHDGMRRLRYDPAAARADFAHADAYMADALTKDELEVHRRVTAVSIRARSLIELDRHAEVPPLVGARIEGYDPDTAYEGDLVGRALIRAHALDPERGYAELMVAEKTAQTLQARRHLAWEQVLLLQKLGTPKAKAEAIKICDQHPGKIDFDERKKALSQ